MACDLLCFVVFKYRMSLPLFVGVASLPQGQFYDCPNAREETLNNVENKAWELLLHIVTTTKQSTGKPCAYFMGFTDIPHCINENLRVVIMPTSGANNDK